MFSQWKSFLKIYYVEFNINWFEVHILALMSVTQQQGLNYFKKTTLIELVENHHLYESNDNTEDVLGLVVLMNELLDEE